MRRASTLLLLSFACAVAVTYYDRGSTLTTHLDPAPAVLAAEHQHEPHASLPVAVDGSKTPELIPDTLAYYHFLMATAPADDEKPDDVDRRVALLQKVGLGEADKTSFVLTLRGLKSELVALAADRRRADEAGGADATVFFRDQETRRVVDSRAALEGSLSTEGYGLLETYIQTSVKPKIVIYGTAVD
jgi:hypothetical protein